MRRRDLVRAAAAACVVGAASRAGAQASAPERKPDLGDVAEGTYFGDVISDSKGSSRADVTLYVKRIGVNRVRVTSDYPRLPDIDVPLQRAMDKIVQSRGESVFLYDWASKPAKLDVTFRGEVSWSGTKR